MKRTFYVGGRREVRDIPDDLIPSGHTDPVASQKRRQKPSAEGAANESQGEG